MSFWGIMNWVAWGLCAAIVIYIIVDVIRVETARIAGEREEKKVGK